MCGRYALSTDRQKVAIHFGLDRVPEFEPRYNIAPTQRALVVRSSAEGVRRGEAMRFGLISPWADALARTGAIINARADTAATKPVFRAAMRKRRCLVPADAFYEWRKLDWGKQPYCIRRADHGLFAFAGLWESQEVMPSAPAREGLFVEAEGMENREAETVLSYAILTTEPNEVMRPVHHRMPVIIDAEHYDRWLDRRIDDVSALSDLLAPCPASWLEAYPVSPWVNSPGHDDAGCQEPARDHDGG